ncbi:MULTISPECIES: hypothetical protein [Bacillus cereus group]|uniref:Uncharacterized protein n=1 Tax=Bacillus thuringiensis TaxID=1428 RepID=A0A9X7AS45_BACTU|nr:MULTISPECIES: hypothetical protein [Bacillus cereus group]EKS7858205.1 hypothetical protein [Bacillus cereus]PFT50855.1 hypothetical protein COK72_02275 [Bacillus thuringiensis]PFY22892.1 hypothetical protein COL44_18595 [Bacillus toyonensis]
MCCFGAGHIRTHRASKTGEKSLSKMQGELCAEISKTIARFCEENGVHAREGASYTHWGKGDEEKISVNVTLSTNEFQVMKIGE